MQTVSERFFAAMKTKPYIPRITLESGTIIEGDAISDIMFAGGANASAEHVSIGSTVAATAELTLDKQSVPARLEGQKLKIELGITFKDGTEWLKMGTYRVTDPKQDDDTVTVVCMDEMAATLDVEYKALAGFDFTSENGVSGKAFMLALCERRGISVELDDLEDVTLRDFDPVGCTERQIVGWFAAMYGRFAAFDREGVLQFRWYEPTDVKVSGDDYYESGMEIAEFNFVPEWLKCYNETMEETITLGNSDAKQGIYFACPWMSAERLETIFENVEKFLFRPVRELTFFGDPRLEAGDIITMTDCGGNSYRVPAMSIRHVFDGGINTSVSAQGQGKTDAYEGPVQTEVKRAIAKIVKRQGEIELSIRDLNGDKLVAMINLSTQGVKIKADCIKLEGLVTANGGFKILEDGSVEAAAGVIGGCVIKDGLLQVGSANVKELLTQDLDVSGTFSQSATVFFEPGQVELDRMYAGISADIPFTAEEIPLYDFDGDGDVTLTDYLTAYNAMVGNASLASWSGAVKTAAKVTIDLKKPHKAICVTGTNMWGRNVEKAFGFNMVFADGNVTDTFNTMLEQSASFKALKEKVDALQQEE